MSCFIVSDETLSKVGNFISRLLNQGYNSFGFEVGREVFFAFEDCKVSDCYNSNRIYEELYKLNVKAYNGRYKLENIDELEIPKKPNIDIDIWEHIKVKNSFVIAQKWHYEMLKKLRCLHYQLEEDATYEDVKTKALEKIINTLAMFIATHNEIYDGISWE